MPGPPRGPHKDTGTMHDQAVTAAAIGELQGMYVHGHGHSTYSTWTASSSQGRTARACRNPITLRLAAPVARCASESADNVRRSAGSGQSGSVGAEQNSKWTVTASVTVSSQKTSASGPPAEAGQSSEPAPEA